MTALGKYIAPGTIMLFLALQGADRSMPIGWAALTLGGVLAALFGAIDLQRPLSRIEKGMALAVVGCMLSAAFGMDPKRSLLLSVPMLASLLMWILITRDRRAMSGFLPVAIGLAIAATVQSSLLVLAAIRRPGLTPADWLGDAGAAWLVVPNDIAWIACVLPLWAVMARRRTVVWLPILFVVFLAMCTLMHSRTAAVVAISVALFFAALRFSRWRPRAGLWIVTGCIAAGVAFAAFGVASMRARLQLWEAAWSMFLDHPWTGVGIHNFALDYRHYLPPQAELIDPRLTPWPHNLILEIAAECGLIGAIAILFLAGGLVRRGLVLGRTTLAPMHCAAFSGLLGMALLALVEASLLRQWVWLVGTALCALLVIDVPRVQENKNEERQPGNEAAASRRLRRAARR